jgi:hypothetical protein
LKILGRYLRSGLPGRGVRCKNGVGYEDVYMLSLCYVRSRVAATSTVMRKRFAMRLYCCILRCGAIPMIKREALRDVLTLLPYSRFASKITVT